MLRVLCETGSQRSPSSSYISWYQIISLQCHFCHQWHIIKSNPFQEVSIPTQTIRQLPLWHEPPLVKISVFVTVPAQRASTSLTPAPAIDSCSAQAQGTRWQRPPEQTPCGWYPSSTVMSGWEQFKPQDTESFSGSVCSWCKLFYFHVLQFICLKTTDESIFHSGKNNCQQMIEKLS